MNNAPDFYKPWNQSNSNDSSARELTRLQRQMDTLFDEFFQKGVSQANSGMPTFAPKCDIEETDSHYVLSFDLPGLKKEDIQIELCGDQLCVSGERSEHNEERKKNLTRSERFYGSFTRSFMLPAGVKPDSIETDYKDGVLHVAIPKVEATKTQSIRVGESKPGFWEKLLGKKSETTEKKSSNKAA